MSHYVVGDIQGCYAEFAQMLDLIGFERTRDRLWLVGDLVNRGPDSLSVLRSVKALGPAATMVLGNHDLHLLIVAAVIIVPFWQIFSKAGYSGWLSFLMLLPFINLIALYVLAFSDWPALRKKAAPLT